MLQISLASEPAWGQEWKGDSPATRSLEGWEEGIVWTTTHHPTIHHPITHHFHHPMTPPPSAADLPKVLVFEQPGRPKRNRLAVPVLPQFANRTHSHTCVWCLGGLNKCWRVMSHVCTRSWQKATCTQAAINHEHQPLPPAPAPRLGKRIDLIMRKHHWINSN